ncbi:MAG: DNA mismatch repair protein MutS [Myxococcota bacterium]
MDTPPAQEYARRLQLHLDAAALHDRRDAAVAAARVAVFGAGVVIAWMAFRDNVSASYLGIPAVVFVALLVVHERINRALERSRRAAALYQRAIERLANRWAGQGRPGTEFADEEHPYARDLDIFGRGSLHELLCTVRTAPAEATLARWLKTPATVAQAKARQEAVRELRNRLDLREDLALVGPELQTSLDAVLLRTWATAPAVFPPSWRALQPLLAVLGVAALGAFIHALFLGGSWWPAGILALVDWAVYRAARPRLIRVIGALNRPGEHLRLLALVAERLERESFQAPLLKELHGALSSEGGTASAAISRLARRTELMQLQQNQLLLPFLFLLLWSLQFAIQIDRWRGAHGASVPRWLESVGALETLCALACYAYEHPDDVFPDVVDGPPRFAGEGLAHPLLPRCVPNDVRLDEETRVIIISGSNMSGKSTLLRTVGTNAVLAMCGAPVRAQRLTLTPLAIGATLRVEDSLQEGRSRFFAELTRLRQLMDMAGNSPPLLFLLDEILHGTNSHDRVVGAEALMVAFLKRGALGLVTTHDLALASAAERIGPHAVNMHFQDEMVQGKMVFDYRMRPGVVTRSNALELMRSLGLEV